MLCSHVVFRQSVRQSQARLASTAAAEARRPRGRPRKTPIKTAETEQARQGSIVNALSTERPTRRGPGRPRKKALVIGSNALQDGQSDASETFVTAKRARSPKRQPPLRKLPPKHHDLASFLEYAAKANLESGTSVYRGHHYEYTVVETLKRYDFTLQKLGRTNDLGIDLLGTWNLPMDPRELRVLIQCKASQPRPSFVRELAGAYAGAPAGWNGEDVMALLIAREPATPGVREALQRSQLPMGFAQITELGVMKQFMWNHAAQETRLTGVSVTNTYPNAAGGLKTSSTSGERLPGAISLLWMGKKWSGANTSLSSISEPPRKSQAESILNGTG